MAAPESDRSPRELLAALYRGDREEHGAVPRVGSPEYLALRERDRGRRARAEAALRQLRAADDASAGDLFHAAWLFNHGETPEEARRAHEWAREAAQRGHRRARWLAAASYDRWRMYQGRRQKYGTQFVPDGARYRLLDVDPTTSDTERADWDVPPLHDQERRAEEMTRDLPQPPLELAPEWLRAAMERWSAGPSEGEGT